MRAFLVALLLPALASAASFVGTSKMLTATEVGVDGDALAGGQVTEALALHEGNKDFAHVTLSAVVTQGTSTTMTVACQVSADNGTTYADLERCTEADPQICTARTWSYDLTTQTTVKTEVPVNGTHLKCTFTAAGTGTAVVTALLSRESVTDGIVVGPVTIAGSVAVTGPLTDSEIRASPVPVSTADDASLAVSVHNGVPSGFDHVGAGSVTQPIQKGALNYIRMRPEILTEYAESSREAQATVNATTVVGQIFKASQDNINTIGLTLGAETTLTTIEDFESYADSAALQVAWVKTGVQQALLETTIIDAGLKSMKLPSSSVGDLWTFTPAAPVDLTGLSVEMDCYSDRPYADVKVRFWIKDGVGNSKHIDLVIQNEDTWQHFSLLETAFTEDQGTATDATDITTAGFEVTDRTPGSAFYVDTIQHAAAPGTLRMKLFNMGSSLPVSGATALADGTQYTTLGELSWGVVAAYVDLDLKAGKRFYHVHDFIAGTAAEIPTNELLTDGNYYAIVLEYVDTDVVCYGPDTSFLTNYYSNGYAFTSPNAAGTITGIGTYSDLQFMVFSAKDVWVYRVCVIPDATPGDGTSFFINSEGLAMNIVGFVTTEHIPEAENIYDISVRPLLVPKGGKVEVNYTDGGVDTVENVAFRMFFYSTNGDSNG